MICQLIILIIATVGSATSCGVGIPILARIPNQLGTYSVDYQCLCPIDYFGIQCNNHRKLLCYLTTKEWSPQYVDSSNFETEKEFNVTFGAQCYIEENNHNFISFINYFVQKQTKQTNFTEQLQFGGEIIWANDTSLLSQEGFAKYQQGYNFTQDQNGNKRLSKDDEEKIFYGKGPYKFTYKSQFLGFPLTDSNFYVKPIINKILQNNINLEQKQLQFINYDNYTKVLNQTLQKEEEARKYYSNFSIQNIDISKLNYDDIFGQIDSIRKQISQFSKMEIVPLIRSTMRVKLADQAQLGLLKAQFKIQEVYLKTLTRKTSINSANVRIPVRVEGIGQATVYNSNFYKPPSRMIYLFIGVLCLGAIYAIYRVYKKRMVKKMKKIQMQVENQYEQNELN